MVGGLKERKTELKILMKADSTSWLYLFVKLGHLKSCIEKNQRCNVLVRVRFQDPDSNQRVDCEDCLEGHMSMS